MSKIALHLSISLAALAAAIATPVLAQTLAITNESNSAPLRYLIVKARSHP